MPILFYRSIVSIEKLFLKRYHNNNVLKNRNTVIKI